MWYFLFIVAFIAVVAIFIQKIAKQLLMAFFTEKKRKAFREENPYIRYHKFKNRNDENYDEYLEWLEKEGHGVPIDKVKMPEDVRAENKIKKLL